MDENVTTLNPPGSARVLLKALKDTTVQTTFVIEQRILGDAYFGYLQGLRGEVSHQIALRRWARGDLQEALKLFEVARMHLKHSALGTARVLRDEALLRLELDQVDECFALLEEAFASHAKDNRRRSKEAEEKAARQRLITQTYVWRATAQTASSDQKTSAIDSLIEFAESEGFSSLVERERLVIVEFLIKYTGGDVRQAMMARRMKLYADQNLYREWFVSTLQLAIDTQVSIAATLLNKLIRRE